MRLFLGIGLVLKTVARSSPTASSESTVRSGWCSPSVARGGSSTTRREGPQLMDPGSAAVGPGCLHRQLGLAGIAAVVHRRMVITQLNELDNIF